MSFKINVEGQWLTITVAERSVSCVAFSAYPKLFLKLKAAPALALALAEVSQAYGAADW
jgi:hypothetical protein